MELNNLDTKSWLAYGRRRGGLYLWDKRSNHDMAGLLDIEEVSEKIKAYDKRSWLSRLWIRLTTPIEKERELVLYRYGCELIEILSAAQTDAGMARCRQVLKEFQVIGQGFSRFSVLKKPWRQLSTYVKGFLTWTKKLTTVKRGEAEPPVLQRIVPQPELVEAGNSTALVVVRQGLADRLESKRRIERKSPVGGSAASASIDSPEAIERYRMREKKDRSELSRRLVQAENRLLGMKERNGERVDECFSDFKKMIRDLKRRYHADKSIVYAKELGLSPEKYVELVTESFQELNPFLNGLREYYEELRDYFEKDYQQTLALKELEEGFKRLFEDLGEIARKQAELALVLNEDNRKKWQAYIDSREAEHTRLDEVFDRMSEKIDRLEKEHQENVEAVERAEKEHQEIVETNARAMKEREALIAQLLELEKGGQALEKEVESLILRRACERKGSQKEPAEAGSQSTFFTLPKCDAHQQITVQPNTNEVNGIVV